MSDSVLTLRQAARILCISEQRIIELARKGEIPHTKLEGGFLRFHPAELEHVKPRIWELCGVKPPAHDSSTQWFEFVRAHDFYIISGVIILFLLWSIAKDLW